MILIDPFSNFLRDEFWKRDGKYFPEMLRVVQSHNELWLAVFTLNMDPHNKVGTAYDKFKQDLKPYAVGLRCPKIDNSGVNGENGFETEILLISSQVKEGNANKLRERLERFRKSASSALGVEITNAL